MATSSAASKRDPANTSLQVHYFPDNDRKGTGTSTMAVCLKPFFGGWNHATSLVEFMEFYLLLGASHFVLYFHQGSVGEDVRRMLDESATNGESTLMR